jgi:hypothetical protein
MATAIIPIFRKRRLRFREWCKKMDEIPKKSLPHFNLLIPTSDNKVTVGRAGRGATKTIAVV